MQITVTQADGVSVLRIAGDLRIASVADAKPEIVAMLASDSDIQIDLGGLRECDTAGLQLLLMTCASARAKGKKFATINTTAAFLAALERVGIPAECFRFQTAVPGSGRDKVDCQ